MEKLVIDTDIMIDVLRGRTIALEFMQSLAERPFVSVVSIAELFGGVREGKERSDLEIFLSGTVPVPVDAKIAEHAGLFYREYRKSHGLSLADALIAATAVRIQARLVSLNRKHFPMMNDLLTPYVK